MSKKIVLFFIIALWLFFSLIASVFLSGCYVASYDPGPIYEDHPHTTEVYYNDIDVYFGYYSGFYYYYGIPHYYPWWYYYQFIPPYHYHTHTHIHVHCDNGHYVYGHRGPTVNNNIAKDFRPTIKVKNNKDKSFVFPTDWKSNNSTRINKNTNYNINKINYNRTFNKSFNQNINKGNNGSTRPNKTRTNQKTKR